MRITKSLTCFVRDVFNTERTKFPIVLHTIVTKAPTVMYRTSRFMFRGEIEIFL